MTVLIYLFRKLRDFLIDGFSTNAPISLELTYLLFFSFSVNGLFIIVAAIIYMSSISLMEMTLLANRKSVLELFKFAEKVNPKNFTEISTDTWIEGFERDSVAINQKSSMSFRIMFKSLKVFVVNESIPKEDFVPAQIVTFPTLLGTWIFVPSKYERMNGLEKFQLLHEIGHLNMRAISLSKYNSMIGVLIAFFTCLFVLYRDGFSLLGVAVLFLVLLLETTKTFLMSSNKINCQIADEMEADNFAFKHAKPEWFKTFPSKSVAEKFCRRSGHPYSTHEIWINHFTDALDSLRKGEPQEDCLDRHYPKSNYRTALTSINYLKAGVFLSAIFIYGSPTLTDAVSLGAISLFVFFLAIVFSTSVKSFSELLLRTFELKTDRESSIDFLRKYVCWYTINSNKHPALKKALLDSIRVFCLKQLDDYDDELEVNPEIASLIQDRLFESHSDFDIYCDRNKSINYIFHGKDLDCEIDHLEFNLLSRRITVVTEDSTRLDLGARVRWLVFPELAKEQYIFINRTKDGESLGGVQVYMKVIAS